jgi:UDPglucose 6-dehydrogenase
MNEMKIAILGTGYVGLSTGVCLSDIGHQVVCIDIDENKINGLCQGISPIQLTMKAITYNQCKNLT